MTRLFPLAFASLVLLVAPSPNSAAGSTPVTPDALPEVHALLDLLHALSGKHILTGQHNYPNVRDTNTRFAARHIGHRPAVFSTDWGHAPEGDSDSYLARPDIVKECIRQHRLGALVTICWHAVPPTADEPITFRQLPGSDPAKLASVQGQLLDQQFADVLTPGTRLHDRWCAQVDAVAVFLKQLQEARVPVLWRPYHEMNGGWFWWGGRTGTHSTLALYRQIFDRLVHHHQLKNLVWVWSVDRPTKPEMAYDLFFPGLDTMDVLSLDVYGNDFAQSYYDGLVRLSGGKPVALAEVGVPPTPEILAAQPLWTFYATWAGMVRNTSLAQYDRLMADPRVLNHGDPAWLALINPYREACRLPQLDGTPWPVDFSGFWVIDEASSRTGRSGAATVPARLEVRHEDNRLTIRSTRILEYAEDAITTEEFSLDGTPSRTEVMGTPRTTIVRPSATGDVLQFESTSQPTRAQPGATTTERTVWRLSEKGRRLTIESRIETPRGPQESTLVFERR